VSRATRHDSDDADMLRLFAFLWAVAHGYHEAKWSHWLSTPSDFALGVAIALVLLRPGALWRLTLLAVLQLVNVAWLLPDIPNHWLIVSFANLALLVAVSEAKWAAAGSRVDPARVWRNFAPAARATVIVVYGWAAFHKLNTDWFDPAVSCATVLMDDWARLFPVMPHNAGVYALMPWIAVAIEAAIPALLLSRRGRVAGLGLALVFHFALGVPRFFNFSAIMLALFLSFAPVDFARMAAAWSKENGVAARIRRLLLGRSRRVFDVAVYVVLVLAAAVVFVTSPWTHSGSVPLLVREVTSGSRTMWSYLFQVLWFPYYVGAMALFAVVWRRTQPDVRGAAELLHAPSRVFLIVPLLALLNGTLPYGGIKTEGAFAMFSNLRTEGDHPNHYLVRASADPFGLQSDLVRIVGSDDPELSKLAARGLSIPMRQLRYYIARVTARGVTGIHIEYERGGVLAATDDAAAEPSLQLRWGRPAAKGPAGGENFQFQTDRSKRAGTL